MSSASQNGEADQIWGGPLVSAGFQVAAEFLMPLAGPGLTSSPEAGVTRGPLELVLLAEVRGEVVPPGEALLAHVALVAWDKVALQRNHNVMQPVMSTPPPGVHTSNCASHPHLVHFLVVGLDGVQGAGGVTAVSEVAVVGGLAAVRVQVLAQVNQVLTTGGGSIGKDMGSGSRTASS